MMEREERGEKRRGKGRDRWQQRIREGVEERKGRGELGREERRKGEGWRGKMRRE